MLGIAIDENTAIVVEDDEFEVIGTSYVIIHDGGRAIPPDPPETWRTVGGPFYFLRPGDRYDLVAREAIPTHRLRGIDRPGGPGERSVTRSRPGRRAEEGRLRDRSRRRAPPGAPRAGLISGLSWARFPLRDGSAAGWTIRPSGPYPGSTTNPVYAPPRRN